MFVLCKEDWCRSFLFLVKGIPSHDTFGRFFSNLIPEAFEKTQDIGFHFGTQEQANNIAGLSDEGSQVYPVYLSINNPVRTNDAYMWYYVRPTINTLIDAGAISRQEADTILNNDKSETEQLADVKALLESKGYDGIVYDNDTAEGTGESYIAFRPEQIKSVNNRGTWDKTDSRIMYQEEGTGRGETGTFEERRELGKPVVQEAAKKFSEQLNEHLYGRWNKRELFELGNTPEILKQLGVASLPLKVSSNVIDKALTGKHKVIANILSRLPIYLSEPVAVFRSKTHPDNSLVVLTEVVDKNNKPVIVSIRLSFESQHGVLIHNISSIYGKDNMQTIQGWFANDLMWADKRKASILLRRVGLQLPKVRLDNAGFTNKRISRNDTAVNNKILLKQIATEKRHAVETGSSLSNENHMPLNNNISNIDRNINGEVVFGESLGGLIEEAKGRSEKQAAVYVDKEVLGSGKRMELQKKAFDWARENLVYNNVKKLFANKESGREFMISMQSIKHIGKTNHNADAFKLMTAMPEMIEKAVFVKSEAERKGHAGVGAVDTFRVDNVFVGENEYSVDIIVKNYPGGIAVNSEIVDVVYHYKIKKAIFPHQNNVSSSPVPKGLAGVGDGHESIITKQDGQSQDETGKILYQQEDKSEGYRRYLLGKVNSKIVGHQIYEMHLEEVIEKAKGIMAMLKKLSFGANWQDVMET